MAEEGYRVLFQEDWLPVQAFFNVIPGYSFTRVIRGLVDHINVHINSSHCEFSDSEYLEPDDEPFEGVRFVLLDEEVVLTWEDFLYALRVACEAQKSLSPNQAAELDEILRPIATVDDIRHSKKSPPSIN